MDWTKDFVEYNGLDSEMAQELAKEAEIEGKIALRLFWDENKKGDPDYGVDRTEAAARDGLRPVHLLAPEEIHRPGRPQDYLWYKRSPGRRARRASREAMGRAGDGRKGRSLLPGRRAVVEKEFVYKKFGGRIYDANTAQPKIMKCLTQIDRLDKALRDLREINHLFASPTPDFKVETAKQATELLEHLEKVNWKIGKAIVHVGEFAMVSPDSAGVQNLIAEIEMPSR